MSAENAHSNGYSHPDRNANPDGDLTSQRDADSLGHSITDLDAITYTLSLDQWQLG